MIFAILKMMPDQTKKGHLCLIINYSKDQPISEQSDIHVYRSIAAGSVMFMYSDKVDSDYSGL